MKIRTNITLLFLPSTQETCTTDKTKTNVKCFPFFCSSVYIDFYTTDNSSPFYYFTLVIVCIQFDLVFFSMCEKETEKNNEYFSICCEINIVLVYLKHTSPSFRVELLIDFQFKLAKRCSKCIVEEVPSTVLF